MLSNHALTRNRTDRQREACMFDRNIDMLWCIQCCCHVHNHRVLSFKYDEHKRANFLQSRGMHMLLIKDRAQLTAYAGSSVDHRRDLDNDSDDNACGSASTSV